MSITYLKRAAKTPHTDEGKTREVVHHMLDTIKGRGEQAVIDYAAKLDNWHGDIVVSGEAIEAAEKINYPPFRKLPPGNEKVVWIKPEIMCTVKYMMKTATGSMRQPVFKGIRIDKEPNI